ncbi:urease accessory protein [Herbaspirillum sp. Sphag1AN]|uniref:urease accessory protein UreD n=1 Tax=unclassified Herbaspirillum TaxID=2624150 RepID=UPI00160AB047|nr:MULTISPECIES: urease accessory protein UreD [unclassified Herbaspirillum]MBB3213669.1 urease accessory protein [Herbaspirillum sp. Sphag1AN]MBB3246867.1 urease accessory protein [Herbaspirillum sp. Sphag64]
MKRVITPLDSSAPATQTAPPVHGNELARLRLGFTNDAGTTRLTERSHFGPLRVQKPLYPEHPSVCHAIIVHPPGGILGGDILQIDAAVGAQAHALLTTPGAGKWYRANGMTSQQQVALSVAAGGSLEWLPQETIFFNDANVRIRHDVELAADTCYIGADILCFGRTASGESFETGCVGQRTGIRREGKLIWFEQGSLQAGTHAMQSPLVLGGYSVCATMIAVGKTMNSAFLQQLREETGALAGDGRSGVSQMKQLLVLRYLGHSSQSARHWLMRAWQLIRPELMQRDAVIPRIWNT